MFTRFRPMTATAMAAILGCSMMAMTAPAAAKEKPAKEEPAKGPKLSPSKAFAPIGKQMEDASKKEGRCGASGGGDRGAGRCDEQR